AFIIGSLVSGRSCCKGKYSCRSAFNSGGWLATEQIMPASGEKSLVMRNMPSRASSSEKLSEYFRKSCVKTAALTRVLPQSIHKCVIRYEIIIVKSEKI